MTKKEDNNVEPLEHLFIMQREMQVTNSKKRSVIQNPDEIKNRKEAIQAAMYYWNAATVEMMELQGTVKNRERLLEEYADVLHFILAMLIYVGYEPKYALKYYFASAWDFWRNAEKGMHEAIGEAWFDICIAWGTIVNDFPYKIWKLYDEKEISVFNKNNLMKPYCDVILMRFFFIGVALGFDQDTIFNAYVTKWKENARRQAPGGKYEK